MPWKRSDAQLNSVTQALFIAETGQQLSSIANWRCRPNGNLCSLELDTRIGPLEPFGAT